MALPPADLHALVEHRRPFAITHERHQPVLRHVAPPLGQFFPAGAEGGIPGAPAIERRQRDAGPGGGEPHVAQDAEVTQEEGAQPARLAPDDGGIERAERPGGRGRLDCTGGRRDRRRRDGRRWGRSGHGPGGFGSGSLGQLRLGNRARRPLGRGGLRRGFPRPDFVRPDFIRQDFFRLGLPQVSLLHLGLQVRQAQVTVGWWYSPELVDTVQLKNVPGFPVRWCHCLSPQRRLLSTAQNIREQKENINAVRRQIDGLIDAQGLSGADWITEAWIKASRLLLLLRLGGGAPERGRRGKAPVELPARSRS